MNKKFLLPLVLFCISATGCSSKPSKLAAPVLSVSSDKTGLVWSTVEGAKKYEVKVNEAAATAATEYKFSSTVGSYSVSVRAVHEDETRSSDFSTPFVYTTAETNIGDLAFNEAGAITWPSLVGAGIQLYDVEKEAYVDLNGTSYKPLAENMMCKFKVKAGWVDDKKTFYVDGKNLEKAAYYVNPAATDYILEDATAESDPDLQELYTVEKYDGGWVTSSASILLNSTVNNGYTPGKCVELKYWRHSAYFKYAKTIELNSKRDTLQFYVRGDGVSEMTLAFQVMDDIEIGGLSLKGVYASYAFPILPEKWQHYTISMDDPNWKIDYGGTKVSFADVKALFASSGYLIDSLASLLTFTNEFQIRVKAEHDENWSTTRIWMDEIILDNSHQATSVEDVTALFSVYSTVVGQDIDEVSFDDEGNVVVNGFNGTYVAGNGLISIVTESPAASFVMKSEDGGQTYDYLEGTGDVSIFEGMKFIPKVYLIDDFQDYESTGQGYDQNHTDPTQATGMRAHYYSDFYNGGSGSPIGGNGWSLMGSTDYLDLSTTVGHNDSKSAKYKYNTSCAMRMISGDICKLPTAPALGNGRTFSFFAKGGSTQNITIKVRVYYDSAQLTPSTQQSNSTLKENIVINANSDWTQIEVPLDPTKTYYGFSITTVANYSGSTDYFYVDDFAIYGSVNPWELIK